MPRADFTSILQSEVARIDEAGTTKRQEVIIEGFTAEPSPKALIKGEPYYVFNSNDYLGMRHHPTVKEAEHQAGKTYGSGPGAVRFISGSLAVHRELEHAIAAFHGRDDAMVISSAFAANLSALFCLLKGQSKDSLVSNNVLVVSDELNHRSIIDGIRLAGLDKTQKAIFKHREATDLDRVLTENKGKFDRVVVVTDGIFSMLGVAQHLKALRDIVDAHDEHYPEGVWLVVDDCHGVAAYGKTGRGVEEVEGVHADVLVGTFGKGFGADGGYIVGSQAMIDYLRESAAMYIYSNSISPATAGAALASVQLVDSPEGQAMVSKLQESITWFKQAMQEAGFSMAADSDHPIQPWFIGDTHKTKALRQALYEAKIITTNINYPVVPKGKDEIRVQLSAAHTQEDLDYFMAQAKLAGKKVGL